MSILYQILRYLKPPVTGWLLGTNSPWYFWVLGILADFLIIGGILFFLSKFIPNKFRKIIIITATFLSGLIYSMEFFWPPDPKTDMNFMTGFTQQTLDSITTVIQAFAVGLGIYSLMTFHGKSLAKKRAGWGNSLAFFIAFLAMVAAGIWKDMSTSRASDNLFDLLFQSSIVPLGATMFSIIGFYIISAAYRAFRIRSAEATLMLVAAFIVMLGQVPVGAWLTHNLPNEGILGFFRLENLSYWILKNPNSAAQRGISFGIEVGALAMALRIWLSLERGSFFEQEV